MQWEPESETKEELTDGPSIENALKAAHDLSALRAATIAVVNFAASDDGSAEHDEALSQVSVFATLAQAEAATRQAIALEGIATHLGNIHQALLTPNDDGEPITVADTLACISSDLEQFVGGMSLEGALRWMASKK